MMRHRINADVAADVSDLPATRESADSRGTEEKWKRHINEKLLTVLDLSLLSGLGEEEARRQIREVSREVIEAEAIPLSVTARQRIVRQIEDEILGLGPLEPILADPTVSDILVNGAHSIYVERYGKLEQTDARFHDDAHLMNIIDRIVSRVGRRIDESSPMVDARLNDGSRVNVIIPPLAIDGPTLSIRRFPAERLDADKLVELGAMSATIRKLFDGVVRGRLNVVISGGTGSGKTTLLNVMSGFIPSDERIVTIEDSAELQLQQPHVVRVETRPANIEGRGEITQRDLVRNALRMRPDRIVVGEVRGSEALDMLQAMNTGHDGSMTTIHANTPRDALTRIESMVAMAGVNIPPRALRAQIASAVDFVIQLERQQDGGRRVVSVQEITGMEGEMITMSEIFSFRRRGLDEEGRVKGEFIASGVVPQCHERLVQHGIDMGLDMYEPEEGFGHGMGFN
ncbi:CpaF family protein [Thiohalomonas denitrificans]|uniref:Pilus assembly protein CpaF n=1 Tax=Thiohalomonas denitrificans TaxID=415747 RepID=A0A1G5QEU1_9GAMM|nr:CpaF family protein [Thiohalomonas denitrificans]SCZ60182.1 pilus assembly protein CpaF [Thiohalomonas denitrificans]